MPPFVRWGTGHLSVLALTVLVPVVLSLWARRDPSGRVGHGIAYALAALLLGTSIGNFLWYASDHTLRFALPLELCDFALFACVVACVARRQLAYELAYFWGLAGTAQGLITPDLDYDFPSPHFLFFFLGHGAIVGTVFFLTAGLRFRPQWFSLARAFAGACIYALLAGVANYLLGTNYGYLCAKPDVASLLDVLGPWPWYIAGLAGVGAVLFTLLYLPWAIADRVRAART